MARPNLDIYEDQVVVWWDHQAEVTTIQDDGTIEKSFTIPGSIETPLYDEDEAITLVLDRLKDAGLSKKAWQQIADCFEGY